MQLCFHVELAEEKLQSLYSQMSPMWAQQICIMKENSRCSECKKKFCMQARNRTEIFWQTLVRTWPNYNTDLNKNTFVITFVECRPVNSSQIDAKNYRLVLITVITSITILSIFAALVARCEIDKNNKS